MSAQATPSALALLLLSDRSDREGDASYWWLWNRHLCALSFLGGHVETNETARVAVARELVEELGATELNERYGLVLADDAEFTEQLHALAKKIGDEGAAAAWPMFSRRAELATAGAGNTVREVSFFVAALDSFPRVRERLEALERVVDPSSKAPLAARLTADQIRQKIPLWPDQPFFDALMQTRPDVFPIPKALRPWEVDSSALAGCLSQKLGEFAEEYGVDGQFAVRLHRPVEGVDPALHLSHFMQLDIRHTARAQSPLRVNLPWPTAGVFQSEADDIDGMAARYTWVNQLITHRERDAPMWGRREASTDFETADKPTAKTNRVSRSEIAALNLVPPDELKKEDRFDIAHQSVDTYGAYIYRIFARLLRPRLVLPDDASDRTRISEVIESGQSYVEVDVEALTPKLFWQRLEEAAAALRRRVNIDSLRKAQRLQLIEPLNSLELISALNRVERFSWSTATLEQLPAGWRQIHPSFRGLICPFETPESKRIGLTLYFADSARVTTLGELVANQPVDDSGLSRSASTHFLPFIAHSDTARTTIAAKNLKQAVPVAGAETPKLLMAESAALLDGYKHATSLWPELLPHPGRNLVVAYMPWYGLNTDDAIVARKGIADDMAWTQTRTLRRRLAPGYLLVARDLMKRDVQGLECDLIDERFDLTGVRKRNTIAHEGDLLASFNNGKGDTVNIRLLDLASAEISKIVWHAPVAPWCGGVLEMELRANLPLMAGDKLMGRYGNKGVISTLLSDSEMPRLPDDDSVPAALRDKPVDLILNPLGIITRMNLGQTLETQLTFGAALQTGSSATLLDASLRLSEEQRELLAASEGVKLVMPDGSKTRMPVAVGWQYVLRLKHTPSLKGNFRGEGQLRGGAYSRLTGQPVRGRRHGGGQSLGEMELWALMAHRANHFLDDVLHRRCRPPESNHSSSSPSLAAIVEHFYALGAALDSGDTTLRLVADQDAVNAEEWTGDSHEYAAKWRCLVCAHAAEASGFFDAPGGGLIVVQRTQNGEPFATLASVSTRFPRPVVEALRDLPFQSVGSSCTLEIREAGSANWTIELSTGSVTAKRGSPTSTLIVTSSEPMAQWCFRFEGAVKTPASWFDAFRWQCTTHKTSAGARLRPECVVTSADQSRRWLSLPEKRLYIPKRIPVLPAAFRPVDPLSGQRHALTSAYHRLRVLSAQKPSDEIDAKIRTQLDAVQAILSWQLLRTVVHPGWLGGDLRGWRDGTELPLDRGQPPTVRYRQRVKALTDRYASGEANQKYGLLRWGGLRRRVDLSGRFVIVPRPRLEPDQCALPISALGVLYGDDIARWLTDKPKLAIGYAVEAANPEYWRRFAFNTVPAVLSTATDKMRQRANDAGELLAAFLAAHPKLRVMLNRQPSLHMHSIAAFRPTLGALDDGWVLGIHPIVCKGFNADFDGDEMTVHAIRGAQQLEEANRLSPLAQEQLKAVATDGLSLWECKQDFALGCYFLAAQTAYDLSAWVKAFSVPSEQIAQLQKFMADYTAALSAATLNAPSVLSGELMSLAERAATVGSDGAGADTAEAALKSGAAPSLAALFGSKARGTVATHARQLYVARGELSPQVLCPGENFDVNNVPAEFSCASSLIHGMTIDELFFASFSGRSQLADKKLLTPKAGSITRQLVLFAWEWTVQGDACESPVAGIYRFASKAQICRKCYGRAVDDGYRAGLIAAQSVGERGTQLSMESYKGQGQQITPETVQAMWRTLLKDFNPADSRVLTDPTACAKRAAKFVTDMLAIEAFKSVWVGHINLLALAAQFRQKTGWLDQLIGAGPPGTPRDLHSALSASQQSVESCAAYLLGLGRSSTENSDAR